MSRSERHPNYTSASLGAAIRETIATFEGCWGGQQRGYSPRTQTGPRHPWGAAIRETVATFEGCWGGQQRGYYVAPTRIPRGLWRAVVGCVNRNGCVAQPTGAAVAFCWHCRSGLRSSCILQCLYQTVGMPRIFFPFLPQPPFRRHVVAFRLICLSFCPPARLDRCPYPRDSGVQFSNRYHALIS